MNERELLLQLIGSLTLCDHIGDLSNDVSTVLKRLGIQPGDDDNDWGFPIRRTLHGMGVTSLYGTPLYYGVNPDSDGKYEECA